MFRKSCLFVLLLAMSGLAHAGGIIPISVYPNPSQFGTIAQTQSSYLTLYVYNTSLDPVVISSMAVTGANSADYAFSGFNACITTLQVNQNCQFGMIFAPQSVGTLNSNLQIIIQGLSQAVNVSLQGTGSTPPPTLTSISPVSAYAGSAAVTMTLTGTGFVSGSTAYYNYNPITTTYVSPTQITAVVPASDLTLAGSGTVYVGNPGNLYSGYLSFNVVSLNPSLNYATPASVTAGTLPSPVTLTGSNFMNGATVLWNGKSLPSTYISSGEITFTPTASEISGASIIPLAVSNPSPGGISNSVNFDVTYSDKVTVLDLPANGLVWDPYAQRIYASIPSSYGTNGNTVAVINPTTGRVTGYYFAGSEPNQLALTADSSYLYVGLNGNGSVQRLLLPSFAPDIDINLGSSQYGGLNTALSLQVSPSDGHTIAVAEGTVGCCGDSGLFFFKDSTQLPDSVTYPTITDVVFANSSLLYGYSNGNVSSITVDANGGTLGQQWSNLVYGNSIAYAGGLIYGGSGQVLNPATGLLVGTYDVSGGNCCYGSSTVLPDAPIDRLFALGVTPFFTQFGVTSYDLAKFTALGVANLSQFSSNTTPAFIRWGSSGVAFILDASCCGSGSPQVIVVQSPSMLLTTSKTKNPAPVAQSLAPASSTHGGGNFLLTVTGTGFVPGSLVTFKGTALAADYVSPTQLNVYVPASSIAAAGSAKVVVTNPAPGGGSSSLTFTIN